MNGIPPDTVTVEGQQMPNNSVVFCVSCHKMGEPVKCWICKMQMCFRCAKPHGAKSLCAGCLLRLDGPRG